MSLTAKDILWPQGRLNPGGIGQHILYAFEEDILTWPTGLNPDTETATSYNDLVTIATPFIMKTGKQFFKLHCTLEEGEVKFTQVGPRDSKSFENSVEISFPGNEAEFLGFIAAAANRKIVALVPEMNGKTRIIGHQLFPAQIESVEGTSGKKVADGRSTKVVIKSAAGTPAPIYTAAIPLTPAA
ncbi:hypothetical protein D3C80_1372810 [compost metagenome]